MKANCAITVVYEGEATRAQANQFCNHFVERFCARTAPDLTWWSFRQLRHPETAQESAAKAAEADVVVLAMLAERNLPAEIGEWLEHWVTRRGHHEGILVGLLGTNSTGTAAETHLRLRQLAHRGRLDYLTGLPDFAVHEMPDAVDPYHDRAYLMTSVMRDILHHAPVPHLET